MEDKDNGVRSEDIKQKDKDIEIAKITAFQASIVALIGASAGIVSTLLGTGALNTSSTSNIEAVQPLNPSSSQGYSIGSVTREIPNNLQECLNKAVTALEGSNFDTRLNQESVWGLSGEYTVSFRCISEKEIAIIIMGGPNDDARRGKLERIASDFDDLY